MLDMKSQAVYLSNLVLVGIRLTSPISKLGLALPHNLMGLEPLPHHSTRIVSIALVCNEGCLENVSNLSE